MTAELRVAALGPTRKWARRPTFQPPYLDHGGRAVHWQRWEIATICTHVGNECEVCGYDGQPWIAAAKVDPLPGETFRWAEERRLPSGRTYARDADVPAWAIWQLTAFLCPACNDLCVYDMGRGGGAEFTEIDINKPALF